MTHTLAIITVIYENYNVFQDFLNSLYKQSSSDFHLFIVDASIHKQPLHINNIKYSIIHTKNKGYADGVNHGLIQAQKLGLNMYCVMNYDTFFNPDFVKNILSSLTKNPASIVGGKIYYAPGFEYHKALYTKDQLGSVIWYAGGEIDWNHALTPHTGVDEVDKGQFNVFKQVSFVTGCLMCFDHLVLKRLGFWDPSYFLYYEDADYSARAVKKTIPLYFDPSIKLWHKVSQITDGSGSALHQKYQNKNRIVFGLKYAPFRTKFHLLKNFFLEKIKTK